MRRRPLYGAALVSAAMAVLLAAPPARTGEGEESTRDIEAARALFERNLDAIRSRDREGYLACYLRSAELVRVGPAGPQLGYDSHAAQTSDGTWPDVIDALDLRLTPIRPGIVFGTYRYRVVYGANELSGISERIFVETPEGWRIAMTSAFPQPEGTPPVPRALTGATLIDGTGRAPVADSVVVMRNGLIECAGSRQDCPVPGDAVETALPGRWITPGLIDAHVHFSQSGWADGRPDFADVRSAMPYERVVATLREGAPEWFRTYLCAGVTAVFDVGGYPWTLALPDRAGREPVAPHVVAAGPVLSSLEVEAINLPGERQILYMKDEPTTRSLVRYVKTAGSSAVKIWWVENPARSEEEIGALVSAAADEARALELPVIVHATSLARARAAVSAGASMLVHSVADRDVDDEFLALAREKGVVYCPTLTVAEGYSRLHFALMTGTEPAADDPLACVDPVTRTKLKFTQSFKPDTLGDKARAPAPSDRARTAAANLKKVFDAGIPVAMGTDAGNPLTLHGASVLFEMLAMQEAGLSPMDVIVAATRGSARAAGRLGDLGTVERGKAADLLVLEEDPLLSVNNFRALVLVVRGGVVRQQEELRAPLE